MERLSLLRDLMEHETEAYAALLALSEQEKDAVVKNDVKTLSCIVEKQQSALTSIRKMEKDKTGLLAGFRAELPDKDVSLADIIQGAEGLLGAELRRLSDQLNAAGVQLRQLNTLNQTLINTQITYTTLCMNLLTGRDGAPGTYSGSGRVNEARGGNHSLVDQAI